MDVISPQSSGFSEILRARDSCTPGNDFNGMMGARISSIFVILLGGSFGALFPIISSRSTWIRMPPYAYFAAKYFGSGVIIATALIHLLQPANEALSDPCLGDQWAEYPYAFGICLFVMFLTFLLDIVSTRYFEQMGIVHDHGPSGLGIGHNHAHEMGQPHLHDLGIDVESEAAVSASFGPDHTDRGSGDTMDKTNLDQGQMPCSEGEDLDLLKHSEYKSMMSQIGSILFLEFGIIFHSVFIGLTLAVSGEEFKTLYIVLVFHQTFEGLGLGTRISTCQFPADKAWVPWALGVGFGLTTPIAIAIGLGVRQTYPPNSAINLITNGIFDSVSSGILLYVGLVELMAKEFLHSQDFQQASLKKVLTAYAIMCLGAGLMALLGRWA
ncbi:low-affinity Zn(2+) transporter ZRT2 [Sugiyamaella lignohabitans]|uniref:Low-affinity Zn(2+) transporter ZRT2 n=1 Tax=Sugiyamaella lignohabitans TaxID=796027 RepID=A0A167FZP1_9ASCO|nr:low-affinity Zn(2+) transporter ZRT2 [Sugiyamaella lignohabitans]ANB15912.1 low-affinity Zn(2+) transporter ZRT2 [Sugiyamaella lignohabitans]